MRRQKGEQLGGRWMNECMGRQMQAWMYGLQINGRSKEGRGKRKREKEEWLDQEMMDGWINWKTGTWKGT